MDAPKCARLTGALCRNARATGGAAPCSTLTWRRRCETRDAKGNISDSGRADSVWFLLFAEDTDRNRVGN